MIRYAVEAWSDALPELQDLWPLHWREIASDRDRIALDPDLERYALLAERGALLVITARDDGQLIGYHVWIVSTHLHYRTTLCGFSDIYWLHPSHRKWFAGIRLFRESEKHLRSLGVRKLYSGTKCWLDRSPIFHRLGWTKAESNFTKYIGVD